LPEGSFGSCGVGGKSAGDRGEPYVAEIQKPSVEKTTTHYSRLAKFRTREIHINVSKPGKRGQYVSEATKRASASCTTDIAPLALASRAPRALPLLVSRARRPGHVPSRARAPRGYGWRPVRARRSSGTGSLSVCLSATRTNIIATRYRGSRGRSLLLVVDPFDARVPVRSGSRPW
jgi:hypothetical protein